jgi:hypothetical protein
VLLEEHLRQGRPSTGRVCRVSVTSGTLPDRVSAAWAAAGLERITLHECRHTYASFLMAAGYTLKEIMEYMGHADLQMVQRYTKLLPAAGRAQLCGSAQCLPGLAASRPSELAGWSQRWSQAAERGRFAAVRCGRGGPAAGVAGAAESAGNEQ